MKISTRGRYGLKALVDLAVHSNDNCVSLKSIAERQGMSEHYLEHIIALLKKAGFVASSRGAQGGYKINKPFCDISVGDVLRVLEGALHPAPCVADEDGSGCGGGDCSTCVTKAVWEKMYDSLNEVMDSITLDDLVKDYNKLTTESGETT